MKTENINEMLKSAVSNAAPDVLDNVLHACDYEKGKQDADTNDFFN